MFQALSRSFALLALVAVTLAPRAFAEAPVGALVSLTDQFQFEPALVTIHVGEAVTFHNASGMKHTVTFDPSRARHRQDVILPEGVEPFSSGRLASGDSFTHVFTVAGSYQYICEPHEGMQMIGRVQVEQ
jgi:plastocyanin